MCRLCHPVPIDIVYTWVNGSDPELIKNITHYKGLLEKQYNASSYAYFWLFWLIRLIWFEFIRQKKRKIITKFLYLIFVVVKNPTFSN